MTTSDGNDKKKEDLLEPSTTPSKNHHQQWKKHHQRWMETTKRRKIRCNKRSYHQQHLQKIPSTTEKTPSTLDGNDEKKEDPAGMKDPTINNTFKFQKKQREKTPSMLDGNDQ